MESLKVADEDIDKYLSFLCTRKGQGYVYGETSYYALFESRDNIPTWEIFSRALNYNKLIIDAPTGGTLRVSDFGIHVYNQGGWVAYLEIERRRAEEERELQLRSLKADERSAESAERSEKWAKWAMITATVLGFISIGYTVYSDKKEDPKDRQIEVLQSRLDSLIRASSNSLNSK